MEILEPEGAGNALLAAALGYARRGWLVFPCRIGGKEPVTRNGLYAATVKPAAIKRWWRAQPYNVAIRTGPESGLWVVDIDPGGDLPGLPRTMEAATGRGRHLYFAEPGLDLPSTAGRIGPGIDTRGRGGYVIAPPSLHPSGVAYRWSNNAEPIAPPAWLAERTRAPRNSERAMAAASIARPASPRGAPSAYGLAALTAECEGLEATGKGNRNNALNLAAFRLGQLVAGGELEAIAVAVALWQACGRNGLVADDGPRQVEATLRSGLTAGIQHPRGRSAA